MRAAPPDLTSLAPCFGPVQHSSLSRTFRPPVAGGRGRKSRSEPARRLMLLPRCGAPRPPLTIGRTMTCRASVVVAGMWSARGRGAALGRRCRRSAAAAAARVQGPGWCRLARAPAALWRCRSRARPRPLLGPAGGGLFGLGRPAVAPLHVAAAGRRRRIEHLRCWGEAHAASRVRGRRHRPVGSALARIDPRIGAVGPRSGCSRVTSMVFCEDREVSSHLIEHFCRTTRILVTFHCKGLELWRLTKSEKVEKKSSIRRAEGTQGPSWCNEMPPKYE